MKQHKMNNYLKNKLLLEKTHNYKAEMEHDACGVGLIATTDGSDGDARDVEGNEITVVGESLGAVKEVRFKGVPDAVSVTNRTRTTFNVSLPINAVRGSMTLILENNDEIIQDDEVVVVSPAPGALKSMFGKLNTFTAADDCAVSPELLVTTTL